MKLQRNNKYSKMIASVLLTSTILTGYSSAHAVIDQNESELIDVVEDTEVHDIPKDENYFYNYYKISDNERENRLRRLDIKYPDAVHRSGYIRTLLVKDSGVYKVLPVIVKVDLMQNVMTFHDLFTEEKLFDYPFKNISEVDISPDSYGDYSHGYDFSNIKNVIPYFDDKEIIEWGVCFYAETFIQKYLDEFKQKDGINYKLNMDDIISYFYTIPFQSDDMMLSTYDYADNYVTTVPLENQVTSEELGVKSTDYGVERKYSDFWKISNEEVENRLNNFEMIDPEETLSCNLVQTLVFEDADKNIKIMNVIISSLGENITLKDAYTNIELFSAPVKDFGYYSENETVRGYTGINFGKKFNEIPYFEDKKIIKLDVCTESNYYVFNNMDNLRQRDGIMYDPTEDSYCFYMYPMKSTDLEKLSYTRGEFARNYVITVPQDMQVYSKDLKLGLDNIKTKTLN